MTMIFPNQDILNQIGHGDQAAFAELCSQYQYPAFKLCSMILKDENEAEDIIRSVFEQMWEDRMNLKAQENFQAYLFSTLRSEIFAQMKRYKDPEKQADYLKKMQTFHL